jgi:putative DNA primase/helicase
MYSQDRRLHTDDSSNDLPPGFSVKPDGIYAKKFLGKDADPQFESVFICGPLRSLAIVRDLQSDSFMRALEIKTLEGDTKPVLIPERLIGDNKELAATLRDAGLRIGTDSFCVNKLKEYLNNTIAAERWCFVRKTGWLNDYQYALLDYMFQNPYSGYEPAFPFSSEHPFKQAGDLASWQTNVGQLCRGNTRLILAVCAALAPPFLRLCGEDSIGLHLIGPSSLGKSTALDVAGSVQGGGEPKFVLTWRTTANALETIAGQRNDALLCLDGLKEVSSRDIGEIVYMIGNGQGKQRATKEMGQRPAITWQVVMLSSGEESLESRLSEVGQKPRGGQRVRFIEIPADAQAGLGLFEDLHGIRDGEAFSLALKAAAKCHYGVPFRMLLHHLVECPPMPEVANLVRDAAARLVGTEASGSEVTRVARKLAVLSVAGELATTWGITRWMAGEAEAAIASVFSAWRASRGNCAADVESGVRQVREFFKRYLHSRFMWVIARRALELMGSYLKHATDVCQMAVRIEWANEASRKVAERSGFEFAGIFEEPGGMMARYVRPL